MRECLNLYMARIAIKNSLIFNLSFLCRLLLIMLDATHSIACVMENLIGCVEGASILDLKGP